MAIKNSQRGFALLVAVIFMAVMLSFALTLSALAYKQQLLTSTTIASSNAFYAADSALECALRFDQWNNGGSTFFPYTTVVGTAVPTASFYCGGVGTAAPDSSAPPTLQVLTVNSVTYDVFTYRFAIGTAGASDCADLTIYKYADGHSPYSTYIFSQGYDVSCGAVNGSGRYAARGLQAHY